MPGILAVQLTACLTMALLAPSPRPAVCVAASPVGPAPLWKGFLFGGIACCIAEGLTFPIDTVKTRLQLSGELGAARQYTGMLDGLRTIAATEGLLGWFKGLSPALLRQATYGTIRYGAYEPIKAMLASPGESASSFPLWKKVLAGTLAGAVSSSLCNPTDLLKVRMQADSSTGTPRYRGMAHAFTSIVKAEGVVGLYRGVAPTCARASVGAASELATYDEIKQAIVARGIVANNASLAGHVIASLCAGLISTVAINPFDVAKSRVMNQAVDARGKGVLYRGMLDCFAKTVRTEGVAALWKGVVPSYLRVGPRVLVIFVIMEQLKARFG